MSNPATVLLSSPEAVRKNTGTELCALMARQVSKPFPSRRVISSSTRSKECRLSSSSAARCPSAVSVSNPSSRKKAVRALRIMGSSSTSSNLAMANSFQKKCLCPIISGEQTAVHTKKPPPSQETAAPKTQRKFRSTVPFDLKQVSPPLWAQVQKDWYVPEEKRQTTPEKAHSTPHR